MEIMRRSFNSVATSRISGVLPECLEVTSFNCSDPVPHCIYSPGFNFTALWDITVDYWKLCPDGEWLYKRNETSPGAVPYNTASLTNAACKAIAGADWKPYPASDIWYRLTTWKFPLLQLVSNSPRPPLGFWVEAFSIAHLLGDPIGTIADLLRKIDSCQSRAVFWRERFGNALAIFNLHGHDARSGARFEKRLWRSFAVIVDSYDEWGLSVGDIATFYLQEKLARLRNATNEDRQKFLNICLKTADALAADRSTKFLPIIVAEAFFIASVAVAIIRTKSLAGGPNPVTYIDIETYSIGFTALFFWVVFTVILTSIVGTSQTAAAIPRILTRFRDDLAHTFPEKLPASIDLPTARLSDTTARLRNGGIYSWQPGRVETSAGRNATTGRNSLLRQSRTSATWFQRRIICPLSTIFPPLPSLIVSCAAFTGFLITWLVPPIGWSCRSWGELVIYLVWLCSAVLSYFLSYCSPPFSANAASTLQHHRMQFALAFTKDLLCTGATMGMVIATQVGIYNKCSCYSNGGQTGLELPQMPSVNDTLFWDLQHAYPAVTATGIAIQLVLLPVLLPGWKYREAVSVFLMRDDEGISEGKTRGWIRKWLRCCCGFERMRREGNECRRDSNIKDGAAAEIALLVDNAGDGAIGEEENRDAEVGDENDVVLIRMVPKAAAVAERLNRFSPALPLVRSASRTVFRDEGR